MRRIPGTPSLLVALLAIFALAPGARAAGVSGTCRRASLTFGLTAPGACVDWGAGLSAGGIGAYNISDRGPNTARLVAATAVPPDKLQDLVAGQEYFSFSLTIDNQKTIGISACAGCLTPGCLLLRSIKVTTPVLLSSVTLEGPANGVDSDWATWRGGGSAIGGYLGCPAATPTAKRTWGAVKALYR